MTLGRETEVLLQEYGNTLSEAVSVIGSTNTTIRVMAGRALSVASDLVVPSNICIRVDQGAMIFIPDGVTLTINGTFEAGLYQVFSCTGTGKVVFGPGPVKEVFPQWWGAKSDETDDTVYLQAAATAASGRKLYIPKGSSFYKVTKPASGNGCINLDDNTTVEFEPGATVKMIAVGTDTHPVFANEDWTGTGNTNIHFIGHGGIIDGDNRTAGSSNFDGGIVLRKVTNCSVKDMIVWDTSGPAINVESAGGFVHIKDNWINGDPLASGTITGCDGAIIIQDATSGTGIEDIIISGNICRNTMEGINANYNGTITHLGKVIITGNILDVVGGTVSGADGINMAGFQRWVIANNIIRRPSRSGIGPRFYNQSSINGVISGNYIENSGYDAGAGQDAHGIKIGRSTSTADGVIAVHGNTIVNSGNATAGGDGIRCSINSIDLAITGNVVKGSNECGINIIGSNGNTAKGITIGSNTLSENGKDGILLYYTNATTLSGNVCRNNGQGAVSTYGIQVNVCSGIVITGNTCTDDQVVKTQTHGLRFAGSTSNITATGNNLVGNGTAAISGDYPATSIVKDNNGAHDAYATLPTGATPSIGTAEVFTTANGAPTTITNFTDGYRGKRLTLIGNDSGNTTVDVSSNAHIKGNATGDFTLGDGDTISFINRNDVWYEVGRSDN